MAVDDVQEPVSYRLRGFVYVRRLTPHQTDYVMVLVIDPDESCQETGILIPRDELSAEHMQLLRQCAGRCKFDVQSMLDDHTGLLATLRRFGGISMDAIKEECGELPYKLMSRRRWRKRGGDGWLLKAGTGERIVEALYTYWY